MTDLTPDEVRKLYPDPFIPLYDKPSFKRNITLELPLQEQDSSPELALNAIASIHVEGLITFAAPQGSTISESRTVSLSRHTPPPVETCIRSGSNTIPAEAVAQRPPSNLPPPGHLSMRLRVGKCIGSGRCGLTYSTTILAASDGECAASDLHMPEFVLKVARPGHRWRLRKETSFYDELESLQGVIMPRCYGWFEGRLPDGYALPPKPKDVDPREEWNETGSGMGDEESDDPSQAEMIDLISVLLLERVGEIISDGPDAGLITKAYPDIEAMFDDIAHMGIEDHDIRFCHLRLPPTSGLPTRYCKRHSCYHQYRIIDFDCLEKNNYSMYIHHVIHQELKGVLDLAMEYIWM